jgi:hypothetical protein
VLRLIFTLDYEIHGNGEGCSHELMVEPVTRLLRLFEEYGAPLTIMADIAEILKFKEYAEEHGHDDYHYHQVVAQLQAAVSRGHDVQLHIHSSYFKARHDGRRWVQEMAEYDIARLSLERLNEMISLGKDYLESTLKPANPSYRCLAFRAANWSVSPAKNVVKALIQNGIRIDTSVFKFGRRNGLVNFDYTDACSNLIPWRVSEENLCWPDARGRVWEFPIYAEKRWLGAFLTLNRIYRAIQSRGHRMAEAEDGDPVHPAANTVPGGSRLARLLRVVQRHAWKADFNQCTGRQLIGALRRAECQGAAAAGDIPFVLIGHSKLFTRRNERSLRPLLNFVTQNRGRFGYAKFSAFEPVQE